MESPEKNLIRDTVLNGALLGLAIMWVLLAALHEWLAADPLPGAQRPAVVSTPVARPGLAATPAAAPASSAPQV